MSDSDDKRVLLAYAATKATDIDSSSPFAGLIPIFQSISQAFAGQPFVPSDLCSALRSSYGLDVPEDLIHYWTKDLVRHNIIEPSKALTLSDNKVYYWTNQFAHVAIGNSFKANLDHLAEVFGKFKVEFRDLSIQTFTLDQFYQMLREGLIAGLFSEDFRSFYAQSENEYFFGRFVEYIKEVDPAAFDFLSELRDAVVISDLLLHAWEPKRKPPDLITLSVYLDGPTVMDALGLTGKARKKHATRLIDLLKQCRAIPLIADVHVAEIRGNIAGVLKNDPTRRFGPSYNAMLKGELDEDVLQATFQALIPAIESLGIKIDEHFGRHIDRSPLSGDIKTKLFARIQSMYNNVEAADRDIAVLAGAISRRGGTKPIQLEKSLCVFVTNNDTLSNYTNKFMRDEFGYQPNQVPLVVTRRSMTSLFGLLPVLWTHT